MAVDKPSTAYEAMSARWHLIKTLLDGETAIKTAGRLYLPQFEAESNANYALRLNSAYLYNKFEQTVDAAVGKPFSKPLVLKGASQTVKDWCQDIDLEGRNLDVFCRDVFRNGVAYGISYLLVDVTRPADLPPRPLTKKDEAELGLRPYLTSPHPANVIEMRYEDRGGRPFLARVRIKEDTWGPSPTNEYEERKVERVRVLKPGSWELHEKINGVWTVVEGGLTGRTYIPMVPFYSKKVAPGVAAPPLEKLAFANLRWYQSNADQINILRVARVPILHLAGFDATDAQGKPKQVEVSSNSVLQSDIDSKAAWVEHSGAAIGAGERDLATLEAQMEAMSLSLIARNHSGDVTATEAAGSFTESHAVLTHMAINFQDALNQALVFLADFGDQPKSAAGEVQVNIDFSTPFNKDIKIQNLGIMRAAGDLSRQTYLSEIQETGFFSEFFDVENELALLETEAPALIGTPLTIDAEPEAEIEIA